MAHIFFVCKKGQAHISPSISVKTKAALKKVNESLKIVNAYYVCA